MTAQAVAWAWWIVGTFGVAGLVAFWFLAPTAAQLALRAVIKAFQFALSYRIGCALLAAIAVSLIVDYQRHAYDDKQSAQRAAIFEAAQRQRDARIAEETREAVWTEIANATAANAVIDTDVKEFSDVLPPPPPTGNPFRVGGDAGRLCHIAGKTECGPAGRKGMSEARRPSGRSGNHAKIRLPSLIRTGVGPTQ